MVDMGLRDGSVQIERHEFGPGTIKVLRCNRPIDNDFNVRQFYVFGDDGRCPRAATNLVQINRRGISIEQTYSSPWYIVTLQDLSDRIVESRAFSVVNVNNADGFFSTASI